MVDETLDENIETEVEAFDPPEIDSKYRMIILAAQRSKQLQRGADARVDVDRRKVKPTRIAMREIGDRKVNFKFTDQEEESTAAS
ncbi:MAG: DNA-directed RNA polymerase subunit omega [Acidobacteria bacterium]|nr:DNA-directed RNA polymerase subunit omega [Acidobacteriota bacterium]